MDLNVILQKRSELEGKINELLEEFLRETGCEIDDITIHTSNIECESDEFNVFYHKYVSCTIKI